MDESTLSFSMASQNLDLDSRRAQEAAIRRYEGAAWLRKMVGVVGAKDLPAEPSEEEFRLGLRSGLILCNVLNKVHPGAVSKVVASSCDSAAAPDGAALSAYQYFEMKLSLPSQEDNLIAMCRSDIPNAQPKWLLSFIPNYPMLNFMLTTAIYVLVSCRLFELTNTLKAVFIPTKNDRQLLYNFVAGAIIFGCLYTIAFVVVQIPQ